jgi:hypothetical protein
MPISRASRASDTRKGYNHPVIKGIPFLSPVAKRCLETRIINGLRITHVEIRFSRHAKRRADLYGIPQSTIVRILKEKRTAPGIS